MAQAMMDGVVLPLATENSEENASSSPDSPELQACKQEMQQLTSQLREKLAVNGLYAWSGQNGLTLSANELHSSASCCQCSSTPSPTHSTSPLLSNSGSTRTNCTFLEEEKQEDEDEEEEDIEEDAEVQYVAYKSELQMGDIMRLIQKDLSEPYSIYTYRYFIHNWPKLCFLAMADSKCVGAVVCKLDVHKKLVRRGYIAMLAVDEKYRKRKIGSNLVLKAIRAMVADDADEVVLETEITNKPALRLYENLGFVRDKRLFRYYLNGVDALRLKLWLR